MPVDTTAPAAIIRPATLADVPALVAMGLQFATAEYTGLLTADSAALTTLAERLVSDPDSVVFVADRDGALLGMLALTTYVHAMAQERWATELAWWMNPDARGLRAGVRLLEAAETWARAHGATRLQMIAPTDHVAAFYERLGFRRVEIHYQRSL